MYGGMKSFFFLVFSFIFSLGYGQVPAYYSSINFTLTGLELKEELSDLITATHTSPTTYDQVWDVLKVSDLDPTNSAVVLLIYGYLDDDNPVTDRTRDKNNNGGSSGQWNREHVFPKSLGSPDLGTSGPGSDPHNLRASDVQANNNRGNRKYATGLGNAGNVGSNWYPGDEWKGDAARIIMYMYLRYGNRCLPSAVAVGTSNAIDPAMIDLLLDWNVSDPVSDFEINRNNQIHLVIGNRNPFIDNPRIATRIWGGIPAEDFWGGLGYAEIKQSDLRIYPNPVAADFVYVSTNTAVEKISVLNTGGATLLTVEPNATNQPYQIDLAQLPTGIYFVQIFTQYGTETKKIMIQ